MENGAFTPEELSVELFLSQEAARRQEQKRKPNTRSENAFISNYLNGFENFLLAAMVESVSVFKKAFKFTLSSSLITTP